MRNKNIEGIMKTLYSGNKSVRIIRESHDHPGKYYN